MSGQRDDSFGKGFTSCAVFFAFLAAVALLAACMGYLKMGQ